MILIWLNVAADLIAAPRDVLDGPIPATVQRVIDGDTLEVAAKVWLGQTMTVRVRLAGIDAPELKSRCDLARVAAQRARHYLTTMLRGQSVQLLQVRHDKYAGRVLATVVLGGTIDVGLQLLKDQMVWRYKPGFRHRGAACPDLPMNDLRPVDF